ncbi:MAG: TIGR03618 family F420-dependent PPOX class oxidoreductase [Myxococcota bacterium]|nr:TIGR03618 family F420-dependent PPOX class oxidoreductase [Myxococcales bacterium]
MPSRRDMIRMSDAEVAAFIEGQKTLQLATIDKDGTPHLVAMWYGILDGKIVIETFEKSQKAVNLRRDPRLTCLLESGTEYNQLKGVQIKGRASLVTDPAEVVKCMKLVLARNHEMDEKTLELAAQHGAKKRVAAVIEPVKIVSWDHTKLDVAY